MKKILLITGILALFLVGCSNVENTSEITLEEYNKLEEGMTYEEVIEIVGSEGDKMVSEDRIEKYAWAGSEEKAMASITFQDGELRGKWEVDLK
ncbi:hypothetical protein [Chengkuizengella sediminis]|uniref:hypothetical protein n=1 Tax=Chengkuizengella sediminis TaxID=1885917 RepID=UPI001389FF8F|nr:hypothetical protein [Chengkuizengella sediminis]NDI37091.1 hypothetical protein [Chengkuizengella sediminis]